MGGCCCCASKEPRTNYSVPIYHHPRVLIVPQPLPSNHGPVSAVSTGLSVDTNLDTGIPTTFRSPPVPVPYETFVGPPRTSHVDQGNHSEKNEGQPIDKHVSESNSVSTQVSDVKVVEADGNANSNVELNVTKEVEDETEVDLKKKGEPIVKSMLEEEEDVCPTCLEEYDEEDPKIITKCEHHFHLACILEWMERSDTCPVCDQEMVFSTN